MIRFSSAAGERPVRLSEETRRFAWESLNGKYGRELKETDHLTLRRNEAEGLSGYRLYDLLVSKIAREAPVRVIPGEMLAGSASLKAASRHVLPVLYEDDTVILYGASHTTLGYDRVLREGIDRYEARIRERLKKECTDAENEFLLSLLNVIDAMHIWHDRYMEAIEDTDEKEALKNVPFKPARSFREGLQSLWFTFAFTRLMGNWPGIGKVDRMLEGLYRHDLASGAITEDMARELLAHFFIKGCEWVTLDVCGSGDGQHYQNIVLAGQDAQGNETAGEVTRLILEVVEELPIGDFPIAVRLRPDSPAWLTGLMARVMRHGSGVCSLYNENLVIRSLEEYHYSHEEAVEFANDGCWEVQIPGKTRFGYKPMDAYILLQRDVLHLFDDENADYPGFDDLMQACFDAMDRDMEKFHLLADGQIPDTRPASIFALLEEGCIEKARDYYNGGPIYNVLSPHYGGLPDMANALIAIKKAVYEEKLLTLKEYVDILRRDWEGAEPLRRRQEALKEYFGNDSQEADELCGRLVQHFIDLARQVHLRNGILRPPGISTFGRQIDWKDCRGAHAQGKKSGEILSGNLNPAPGTDRETATAIIRSHCSVDLSRLTCGTALDIKLDPSCARGEEGLNGIQALIHGFLALGGFFMQIDVIDNSVLLDAREHPEKYPTLAVRISGWSARFVTLDENWQRMIIERTAMGNL